MSVVGLGAAAGAVGGVLVKLCLKRDHERSGYRALGAMLRGVKGTLLSAADNVRCVFCLFMRVCTCSNKGGGDEDDE